MNKAHQFWLDKWQTSDISFHRDQINPTITTYFPQCHLPQAARVLVPLCGKSLDMCWLMAQGYNVVGIELSAIAIETFFAEQQLTYTCEQRGDHVFYTAPQITIIQGDIFTLDTTHLEPCAGYYDRAALIALPAKLRMAYVATISQLLVTNAQGIVSSVDYTTSTQIGPPFNITDAEIQTLFADYTLEQLSYREQVPASKSLMAKGITTVTETVYKVIKLD